MTDLDAALVAAHLLATTAMVGLIWFVQVVHYPLFARVPEADFAAYEAGHTRRTSWVVGPFMGIEGACAVALALAPPPGVGSVLPLVGLVLLGAIHLSTVALQVPAHQRLGQQFDRPTWRRLVATNWIRTAGWTARSMVALAVLWTALTA